MVVVSIFVDVVFAVATASSPASSTGKVWDVTTQQCSATLTHHSDKVQGVSWHPVEATVMATVRYVVVLCGLV